MTERINPGGVIWNEVIAHFMHRYRFGARLVSCKRVLDASCWIGYGCKLLADCGADHVTQDLCLSRSRE